MSNSSTVNSAGFRAYAEKCEKEMSAKRRYSRFHRTKPKSMKEEMKEMRGKSTLSLLREKYPERCTEERLAKYYESFPLMFGPLAMQVTVDSGGEGKTCRASIAWSYSSSTEVVKTFEGTWSGFQAACSWLDEQRVEFAKQLM